MIQNQSAKRCENVHPKFRILDISWHIMTYHDISLFNLVRSLGIGEPSWGQWLPIALWNWRREGHRNLPGKTQVSGHRNWYPSTEISGNFKGTFTKSAWTVTSTSAVIEARSFFGPKWFIPNGWFMLVYKLVITCHNNMYNHSINIL